MDKRQHVIHGGWKTVVQEPEKRLQAISPHVAGHSVFVRQSVAEAVVLDLSAAMQRGLISLDAAALYLDETVVDLLDLRYQLFLAEGPSLWHRDDSGLFSCPGAMCHRGIRLGDTPAALTGRIQNGPGCREDRKTEYEDKTDVGRHFRVSDFSGAQGERALEVSREPKPNS